MARYAALVQEAGMVPIIEPEVLMDGDHSSQDCLNKTSEVIEKCFEELEINNVDLKGIILKPNMILPGSNSKEKLSNKDVAELTLECLKKKRSFFSSWHCFSLWWSRRIRGNKKLKSN